MHHKHVRALEVIPRLRGELEDRFGRPSGALVDPYRTDEAETILVALGSVNGTIKDAVDALRDEGWPVGAVKLGVYRPFPAHALRRAVQDAKRVIVFEKDLAVGHGGIVSGDVKMALKGLPIVVETVIAGLGGRAIPKASILRTVKAAMLEGLEEPHFLDLKWAVVNNELRRQEARRRSGPIPENILRETGPFGVKVT